MKKLSRRQLRALILRESDDMDRAADAARAGEAAARLGSGADMARLKETIKGAKDIDSLKEALMQMLEMLEGK